ncbi:MAG: Lrp/AsnC family transcriptional regulator [Rhodospirillaceae bacterium]|jgi:siroheme decarboxylase|nr:Lrp/AsnC family transcriptional regulator [Rhodospirillaceae bacterium]MBT4589002.1 Lrp/AsnC family transcriptional regulator [Rhodospirillaceae bacterium]MBT4939084.1 Lrp/AsnC family transcriptional regulator [Rhodospirillaceae bacterium]MBT5940850.1 Lrp/AsnC family transcriptional regulator [Rhodospirillaceae bacterium]MBT7266686.1 Lrp/AsnC family transcriptional regulator [Rhodospirillaceae bacterium]
MNNIRPQDQVNAFDEIDRAIVAATQSGLPLVAAPYEAVAAEIGISADEVMTRLQAMLKNGIIRRIGVVPNHYALGLKANGMSVWQVPEEQVNELGKRVGALDFVTHCYSRPQHLPDWPYNLFAMVHGKSRDEVFEKVQVIADLLDDADQGHDVLFSSKILKKTGLRISRSQ